VFYTKKKLIPDQLGFGNFRSSGL